ncbi:hypothetical protein [Bradyrhizobium sp. Ash2021]|uniref:hypothetical protein n=1 Tax=Bradyrhizobium sp. Ash2021 TaxID=2954771 RepID=UPI0028152DF8|nr:hypothetical protein [Bradyrhizobium sp. Ash2021]WMT76530.1 hypothetical protein NL528_09280 [Bradyrhizobium sp. Ash2021]
MAYVKVHQIGAYTVLRYHDTLYVTVYDAEKKQPIWRSLHTSDFAIAAVQSLTERRADGHVEMVR